MPWLYMLLTEQSAPHRNAVFKKTHKPKNKPKFEINILTSKIHAKLSAFFSDRVPNMDVYGAMWSSHYYLHYYSMYVHCF